MEGKWEGVKGVLGVVDGCFEVTHGNDYRENTEG